ncbi:unnamed protein product [Porites lobata]|uniref:G-protein coupled receptors family 1 profile domain-containing protein n=1 Tax=Porites lobata TaxID=104759 RepID=A0ABN8RZZ2_9CNID|nr:unnamed protein product [Porites lobata]
MTIVFEILPCVILILCFVSVIFHVRRHDRSTRTLAKQLRFNHQVSFKTHHEKSAVIMMGLVIGVFLVCYGMYLRCSFLILSQTSTTITSSPCHDQDYKIPLLVLNSAINPLAYFWSPQIPGGLSQIIVWKHWCLRRVQEPKYDKNTIQYKSGAFLKRFRGIYIKKDLLPLYFKENTSILTKPYHRTRDSILEDVGLKRR